jgi:hypothetical protein
MLFYTKEAYRNVYMPVCECVVCIVFANLPICARMATTALCFVGRSVTNEFVGA